MASVLLFGHPIYLKLCGVVLHGIAYLQHICTVMGDGDGYSVSVLYTC